MAQKKNKQKTRQIGKTTVSQKKPLIDPRYKNAIWTVVIIIVLVIFFIVNNTRSVPEQGPYPPGFNPKEAQKILHESQ
jgi:uncharacterized integral membrane protein